MNELYSKHSGTTCKASQDCLSFLKGIFFWDIVFRSVPHLPTDDMT